LIKGGGEKSNVIIRGQGKPVHRKSGSLGYAQSHAHEPKSESGKGGNKRSPQAAFSKGKEGGGMENTEEKLGHRIAGYLEIGARGSRKEKIGGKGEGAGSVAKAVGKRRP